MKKGRAIEVIFFGEHSVVGVVEAVDKVNTTILIGRIRPGWFVEIAPEGTGHGLPLSKCEAYKRVYDQPYGSS